MFITGPEVVKTVTGEEVGVRGAGRRATRTPSRSRRRPLDVAADERALIEDCRYLLSFLPQLNGEPAPWEPPADPVDREAPSSTG